MLKFSKKTAIISLVIFLITVAVVFGCFKLAGTYKKSDLLNRAYSILSFDLDASRKAMWQTATNAFLERPVLGWGVDSFSFIWDKYSYFKENYSLPSDKPHNKILEVAVSAGAAGLVFYLAIFCVIFYLVLRQKGSKYSKLVLAGFFTCYFVENLFLFDTISTYIIFFLVAGFVNNSFVVPKGEARSAGKTIAPDLKIIFAIALALFMGFVFYNLNLKTALAGMYFSSGDASKNTEPAGALFVYSKSVSQNTFYDYDLTILVLSRLDGILESNPPPGIKALAFDIFSKMKPGLQKYTGSNDQNRRGFYFYTARIYEIFYLFNKDAKNLEEAQNILEKVINYSRSSQDFYLEMAKVKIFQGKKQAGLQYAEKFYEMTLQNPIDEEKMYLALAESYLNVGDFENGLSNAKKVLDIDYALRKSGAGSLDLPGFTNSIALMYYSLGKTGDAVKTYQRAMEIYPEQADLWRQGMEKIGAN